MNTPPPGPWADLDDSSSGEGGWGSDIRVSSVAQWDPCKQDNMVEEMVLLVLMELLEEYVLEVAEAHVQLTWMK